MLNLTDHASRFASADNLEILAERTKKCRDLLSAGTLGLSPRDLNDDTDFMTHILFSLALDYKAIVNDIKMDQWGGISAQTRDSDISTYVEFDNILDGFVLTWMLFYENQEQSVS